MPNGLFKVFASIGVMGLADVFMQPLHNIQSRFILQNRLPQFATYKSLYFAGQNIFIRELYQGWQCAFPLKFGTTFGAILLTYGNTIDYIVLSNLLAYTLFYPLLTVQRRLECQSTNHTMLPRRYLGVRFAFSRIYHEEGFKAFYRGFICNGLATSIKCFSYYLIVITLSLHDRYATFRRDAWNA